ncbi:MAG: hypothetical protein Q9M22_05925 [Mariprofundaceae bacterium]|nr:hypothetical protein [Mariprofundaceae bacterium]
MNQSTPETPQASTQKTHDAMPSEEILDNKQQKTKPKKRIAKRMQLFTVLTIAMLVVGGGTWLLWLEPLLHHRDSPMIHSLSENPTPPKPVVAVNTGDSISLAPKTEKKTSIIASPSTEKKEQNSTITLSVATEEESIKKPENRESTPVAPVQKNESANASSQHVEPLKQAITVEFNQVELKSLHADIETLRRAITTLQQQYAKRQQQQLIDILDQIISPDTTLPQQLILWQSVAMQQGLSAERKQQALTIVGWVKNDIKRVNEWMKGLQKIASTLEPMSSTSIIPRDYWWQKWIGEHISLRHLPNKDEQEKLNLRQRILFMIERLSHEQWPNNKAWESLVALLSNQPWGLSLPKDISSLAKNSHTIRQVARAWKEQAP